MAVPKRKRTKPKKPYPSFPLTTHNNGQWCKKIRGKIHFFGVWDDPQAALEQYLRQADDLHTGRQPRASSISSDRLAVKDVGNHFLTYQLQKVEAGEITARWFEDCRRVIDSFAKYTGPNRLVSDLTPDDFRRFRQKLSRVGLSKNKNGLGVHALNRAITVIKGMFKYSYEMDLLENSIKFGRAFDKPSAAVRRKSRQAAEQANGKKLFGASEIHAMLNTASIPLQAMVLLGINGGFGNTDCACLPISAVNLEQGVIEFQRPKTGIERVVPLWQETIKALGRAMAVRPIPVSEETEKLLFLTPSGGSWIRQKIYREEQNIKKVVNVDSISQQFGKLLNQLSLKRKGLGFYTLRHTFRTWADETRDQHAIHRTMGHVIPGMSGIYVEEISSDRLRAVTEHVRAKLFGG